MNEKLLNKRTTVSSYAEYEDSLLLLEQAITDTKKILLDKRHEFFIAINSNDIDTIKSIFSWGIEKDSHLFLIVSKYGRNIGFWDRPIDTETEKISFNTEFVIDWKNITDYNKKFLLSEAPDKLKSAFFESFFDSLSFLFSHNTNISEEKASYALDSLQFLLTYFPDIFEKKYAYYLLYNWGRFTFDIEKHSLLNDYVVSYLPDLKHPFKVASQYNNSDNLERLYKLSHYKDSLYLIEKEQYQNFVDNCLTFSIKNLNTESFIFWKDKGAQVSHDRELYEHVFSYPENQILPMLPYLNDVIQLFPQMFISLSISNHKKEILDYLIENYSINQLVITSTYLETYDFAHKCLELKEYIAHKIKKLILCHQLENELFNKIENCEQVSKV